MMYDQYSILLKCYNLPPLMQTNKWSENDLKRLEMVVTVLLLISFEFFEQKGTFLGYNVHFPLDNQEIWGSRMRAESFITSCSNQFLSHSHNVNVYADPTYSIFLSSKYE